MRTNFVTPVRVVGDDYKGFAYPVRFVGDGPSPSPTPDPGSTPEPIDTKDVFATALIANGVYPGGSTQDTYLDNISVLMNALKVYTTSNTSWTEYVQSQGSFENAINSCITASNRMNLKILKDAGFFDFLDSYKETCLQSKDIVAGSTSLDALLTVVVVNDLEFYVIPNMPAWHDEHGRDEAYTIAVLDWGETGTDPTHGKYHIYRLLWTEELPANFVITPGSSERYAYPTNTNGSTYTKEYRVHEDTYVSYGKWSTTNTGFKTGQVWPNSDFLIHGRYQFGNMDFQERTRTKLAVAAYGVINLKNEVVEIFTPTSEKLENGYNYSDVVVSQ